MKDDSGRSKPDRRRRAGGEDGTETGDAEAADTDASGWLAAQFQEPGDTDAPAQDRAPADPHGRGREQDPGGGRPAPEPRAWRGPVSSPDAPDATAPTVAPAPCRPLHHAPRRPLRQAAHPRCAAHRGTGGAGRRFSLGTDAAESPPPRRRHGRRLRRRSCPHRTAGRPGIRTGGRRRPAGATRRRLRRQPRRVTRSCRPIRTCRSCRPTCPSRRRPTCHRLPLCLLLLGRLPPLRYRPSRHTTCSWSRRPTGCFPPSCIRRCSRANRPSRWSPAAPFGHACPPIRTFPTPPPGRPNSSPAAVPPLTPLFTAAIAHRENDDSPLAALFRERERHLPETELIAQRPSVRSRSALSSASARRIRARHCRAPRPSVATFAADYSGTPRRAGCRRDPACLAIRSCCCGAAARFSRCSP